MPDQLLEYHSDSQQRTAPRTSWYGLAACLGSVLSMGLIVAFVCKAIDDDLAPLAFPAIWFGFAVAALGTLLAVLQPNTRPGYALLAALLLACTSVLMAKYFLGASPPAWVTWLFS